jgi:integrase
MRRPFQLKNRAGWQAEYKFSDGTVQRLSFDDAPAAQAWLDEQARLDEAEQGPLFGGPARITLGQFLGEYAARFSIAKKGYDTEIDRINHYVTALGLPRLKVVKDGNGNRKLVSMSHEQALPAAFQAHLDSRMAQRAQTYAWMAKLARKKVSQVSTDDIRQLMTLGSCEQWSDGTIQKEVALLKAAFNSAVREWRWTGFKNPCQGLKLGKSNRRFVVVTDAQMQRLVQALSECDNPQFWPLVDLAIHSTLRQDSLLSMKWSQTNLETRRARVWAKVKWMDAQLPRRAVDILASMPRGADDRVFTMSQNAVNMAWEGVREKAQLDGLTFRDLRHVGATRYAKAGLGAHALMHLLGHTTTRMAEVYVNLARSDVLSALDAVDDQVAPMTPVPPTTHAHGMHKHPRARKPALATNVFHLVNDGRQVRAMRQESKAAAIEASQVRQALPAPIAS